MRALRSPAIHRAKNNAIGLFRLSARMFCFRLEWNFAAVPGPVIYELASLLEEVATAVGHLGLIQPG